MDPYAIEGPAVISFSGGRTSGYMLRKILDAGIGPDVHILFSNTGKEREETLTFVARVGEAWGVTIHWLERYGEPVTLKNGKTRIAARIREVGHADAARAGEPFVELIRQRNFLPNPVTRYCTQELKIRAMKRWMLSRGYRHWVNVIGLRADEPGRVARQAAANEAKKERWEVVMPLAVAGVTRAEVEAFWSAQAFNLELRPWEGNCDLCFLKGRNRKMRVIRDNPELAEWWIERERERERVGVAKPGAARFRNDQPTYAKMLAEVAATPLLPGVLDNEPVEGDVPDDSIDCFCTN